jgi:3'-5' exoribonuclease
MAALNIPMLQAGDRVQETFLVIDSETRSLDTGELYTLLRVGNSTGEISTEPFWPSRQNEIAGVQKGQAVDIIGEVGSFRQKRQLKVTSIRVLPKETVDLSSLLPSVGPVDRYWETIDGWRRSIGKLRLKRVLDLFFEDDEFRLKFEGCPASVRGHHAQLGGLLKHTTEVAAIARAVARASGADLDLVLAGVLLHDIGKLESYRWDGTFDYTIAGSLLGHVVIGALMFDRRLEMEKEPPCTTEERQVLQHLILSHHGKLEYGSPVQPMTLEAEVLHWADNASAKTASMSQVLRDEDNFAEGLISKPNWQIDRRRVYRMTCDWGTQPSDNRVTGEPG